jgi:hypothetical protein
MSSSSDILTIFFTSIEYIISPELQTELKQFFPSSDLSKYNSLQFLNSLFSPIDFTQSQVVDIQNFLYVVKRYRIYTNSAYSFCSTTDSLYKQTYYNNINNYITKLESCLNNININNIWISDSMNTKLNTYQSQLQTNAYVITGEFFDCEQVPTSGGTSSIQTRRTNIFITSNSCKKKDNEVWKVKKIKSRFIENQAHFDYMKQKFPNFNKLHIQRYDTISLIFPYTSKKLKPLQRIPSNFQRIYVEDFHNIENFNINRETNSSKIYTIYLPSELLESYKLKITHYTIRGGKRSFVCLS